MKTVIIGGSHAGTSAARFLKRLAPDMDVTIVEKSTNLGFIPSTVNLIFQQLISPDELQLGEVTDSDQLTNLGIQVLESTKALRIDPHAKQVFIQSVVTNEEQCLAYDRLILAMGSEKFELMDASLNEPSALLTYKEKEKTKNAYEVLAKSSSLAIIGAGLIGLELASSISKNTQKEITIVEQMDRPLFRYFDSLITDSLLKHLPKTIHFEFQETFSQAVKKKDKVEVRLFAGKTLEVDACVFAMNPKPESRLVKNILALDFDDTVIVDAYMRTSDPDIYAIGDLIRIPFGPIAEHAYLPLIANARRTALIAANNIVSEQPRALKPSQRTIGTELFGLYLGSSGITKAEADFYDLPVAEVVKSYDLFSRYHLPKDFFLTIKLLYATDSRKLLGAQLITNRQDVLELINVLSQTICDEQTIDDLVFSDLYFSPQLSPSINFLADLGLEAQK